MRLTRHSLNTALKEPAASAASLSLISIHSLARGCNVRGIPLPKGSSSVTSCSPCRLPSLVARHCSLHLKQSAEPAVSACATYWAQSLRGMSFLQGHPHLPLTHMPNMIRRLEGTSSAHPALVSVKGERSALAKQQKMSEHSKYPLGDG